MSYNGTTCPACHKPGGPFRTPQGEVTCRFCSAVLDESNLVSEVTFAETSAGAATVTGQFVSADRTHISTGGNRLGQSNSRESREHTIEKTKKRIHSIAAILHIAEHVSAQALQFFVLALNSNFVKGRKSQYVVSACLYLACRVNHTQHMLMDFAEVLCVNVFAIGTTYLQLVRSIHVVNVPLTDPTVYVRRFTVALEFGDQEKQVREDAGRVVARMGKDWLIHGRRPAGVAAAAVIIAARMNNFRRSKLEIVQIAKIAEETIQRRLDEFKFTSASTLTIHEFRNTNIESEADPPSFIKHREMETKLAQLRAEHGEDVGEDIYLNPELIAMAKEIKELEEEERKEKKRQRDLELANSEIGKEIDEVLNDPTFRRATQAEEFLKTYREKKEEEKRARQRTIEEVETEQPEPSQWVSKVSDDPDNLEDVEDDEIDSLLLTNDEAKLKEQVWMSLNAEYLVEEEKRRLKREAEMEAGTYKPKKRTKHKAKNNSDETEEISAETSIQNALASRKISRKLNYEKMSDLFRKN